MGDLFSLAGSGREFSVDSPAARSFMETLFFWAAVCEALSEPDPAQFSGDAPVEGGGQDVLHEGLPSDLPVRLVFCPGTRLEQGGMFLAGVVPGRGVVVESAIDWRGSPFGWFTGSGLPWNVSDPVEKQTMRL